VGEFSVKVEVFLRLPGHLKLAWRCHSGQFQAASPVVKSNQGMSLSLSQKWERFQHIEPSRELAMMISGHYLFMSSYWF
jgi:hypothetical protein